MFCYKCGEQIDESASKCPHCLAQMPPNMPVKQGVSVMAIIALIFGIFGLCGGAIPIVRYFTFILSVLAVFLGSSARKSAKLSGQSSGAAIAGIVLGLIGIIFTVIIIVFAGALIAWIASLIASLLN